MKKKALIISLVIFLIVCLLNPSMEDFKNHVGQHNSLSPEKDDYFRNYNFIIFSIYSLSYCNQIDEEGGTERRYHKKVTYIGILKNFIKYSSSK